MPRYFFDTHDGTEQFRDEVGLDMDDDEAARDEGTRALAEMAQDHLPGTGSQKNITMWVRNERGETILELELDFSVRPPA